MFVHCDSQKSLLYNKMLPNHTIITSWLNSYLEKNTLKSLKLY